LSLTPHVRTLVYGKLATVDGGSVWRREPGSKSLRLRISHATVVDNANNTVVSECDLEMIVEFDDTFGRRR
jgi:hypothetical protein